MRLEIFREESLTITITEEKVSRQANGQHRSYGEVPRKTDT
jgi:hypothetical protein